MKLHMCTHKSLINNLVSSIPVVIICAQYFFIKVENETFKTDASTGVIEHFQLQIY
jgi:hypothetical protein